MLYNIKTKFYDRGWAGRPPPRPRGPSPGVGWLGGWLRNPPQVPKPPIGQPLPACRNSPTAAPASAAGRRCTAGRRRTGPWRSTAGCGDTAPTPGRRWPRRGLLPGVWPHPLHRLCGSCGQCPDWPATAEIKNSCKTDGSQQSLT